MVEQRNLDGTERLGAFCSTACRRAVPRRGGICGLSSSFKLIPVGCFDAHEWRALRFVGESRVYSPDGFSRSFNWRRMASAGGCRNSEKSTSVVLMSCGGVVSEDGTLSVDTVLRTAVCDVAGLFSVVVTVMSGLLSLKKEWTGTMFGTQRCCCSVVLD